MHKVSVIIPTYNRFSFVFNAINSALSQSYPNLEIIVINDNSSDKRYDSFNWDSLKIKYFKTDGKGVCFSRNLGIEKSKGDYIAFLDDDDMLLPLKIEKQIKNLGSTMMSCTEGYYSSSSSTYKTCNRNFLYFGEKYVGYIKNCIGNKTIPNIIKKEHMLKHNIMVTSSVLIEKGILQKCNGFIMDKEHRCEDWPLWKRCLEYTDCIYVNEPLFYYNNTPHERNALKRGVSW